MVQCIKIKGGFQMHKKSNRIMAGIMAMAMVTTANAAVPTASAEKMTVQVLGESTFDEKAMPWQIVENSPAKQEFSLEDGAFNIKILVPEGGEHEKWDLQLRHKNLNFRKGHEYKVSFKVKSNRANMELCSYIGNIAGIQEYFELDGRSWDSDEKPEMHMGPDMGGNWPLSALKLTTEWQEIEGIFKPTQDLEACQWTFQYAKGTKYQGNAREGDEIWFDDISIECLTCEEEGENECGWRGYNDFGIVTPKSDVRLNQMGYYPNAVKKATYVTTKDKEAMEFNVVDKDGKAVYTGKSVPVGYDKDAGEYCHIVDFTSVKTPGTYTIVMDDEKNVSRDNLTGDICKKYISHEFKIGDDVYDGVLGNAMNYFYQNRSGSAVEEKYITSGDKKALAHEDVNKQDIAYVQQYWWKKWRLSSEAKNDVELDVSGGWYQSDDYVKSVQYGGGALWLLQNMYEMSKASGTDSKWADGKTMTIPDSYKVSGGKDISCKDSPDILDEARYELEFMFRMIVDPEKDHIWGEKAADLVYDSVVYSSQLPTPYVPMDYIGISDYRSPSRVVNPPSYAATLNMIACAAQASRLWKGIDDDFSKECLDHAKKSWEAVMKHDEDIVANIDPNTTNPFCAPIGVLYYDNFDITDDAYWAACELYATTGDKVYYDYIRNCKNYVLSRDGEKERGENLAFQVPFYAESYDVDELMTSFDSFNKTSCGSLSLYLSDKTPKDDKEIIKKNLLAAADKYIEVENDLTVDKNAMGIPYKKVGFYRMYGSNWPSDYGYDYGSNSRVTNNAVIMSYAYDATGDGKYLNGAMQAMDYIFGRNGLGFSYVTGCGSYHVNAPTSEYWIYDVDRRFPKAPDGVMVGGPCSPLYDNYVRMTGLKPYEEPSQKCYADAVEAWSVNSSSPDWQAALAWNMSFLEDKGAKAPEVNTNTTTATTTVTTTTTTVTTSGVSSTTTLTTSILSEPPEYGDANCDGKVDMGDVVLIMQALANPDKYGVGGTDKNAFRVQGWSNADVYDKGSGVTTNDALAIQEFLLGKVKELPVAAAK